MLKFLQVTFDPDTGLLSSLSNLETKQTIKLTQNFYWLVSLIETHTNTPVDDWSYNVCVCVSHVPGTTPVTVTT